MGEGKNSLELTKSMKAKGEHGIRTEKEELLVARARVKVTA